MCYKGFGLLRSCTDFFLSFNSSMLVVATIVIQFNPIFCILLTLGVLAVSVFYVIGDFAFFFFSLVFVNRKL